jgi:hypothetical protein
VSCPCAPQPMLSGSMTTRCVVIVRACREIQRPRGRCPPLAYVSFGCRVSVRRPGGCRVSDDALTDRRIAGAGVSVSACDEGQKTLSQYSGQMK